MIKKPVYIIAEAGVNHNGSLDLAKRLVDVAKDAGADAVKFQTWKTELLVTESAEKADYQKRNTPQDVSQYGLLKSLELSYQEFTELKEYCDKKNIDFLSTPDEFQSADFLYDLQDVFKISSGEITNFSFLQHIGKFNKKVILSTGMANMQEIEDALGVLIDSGMQKKDITVLHCNSQYPTPMEDVNLRAMQSIAEKLKVKVGYSDHTLGIEVPIAAVAMGAEVIEKHFTLDRNMEGPDHRASLEPDKLKEMVKAIRNIEVALGSSVKKCSPSEEKNITVFRKSIVARKDIRAGELFSIGNLETKRPGSGISPMYISKLLGAASVKDYKRNEQIEWQ